MFETDRPKNRISIECWCKVRNSERDSERLALLGRPSGRNGIKGAKTKRRATLRVLHVPLATKLDGRQRWVISPRAVCRTCRTGPPHQEDLSRTTKSRWNQARACVSVSACFVHTLYIPHDIKNKTLFLFPACRPRNPSPRVFSRCRRPLRWSSHACHGVRSDLGWMSLSRELRSTTVLVPVLRCLLRVSACCTCNSSFACLCVLLCVCFLHAPRDVQSMP